MSAGIAIALVAVAASSACALGGVFLVLRRMAMMADAISHAILPGLVAGYVLANGPNLLGGFLGAAGAGLLTVVLVEALTKSRRVKEDSAIGIVFPAMFALGVFVVSKWFSNVHIDTDAVLYGQIEFAPFDTLTVGGRNLGPQSLWVLGGLTLVNAAFMKIFYKELKISTFDPQLADILGFRSSWIHYGLMALVAVTTVGAFSAVGAILSVALIVVPATAASLLTRKLHVLIPLSLAIGAACGLVGYGAASLMELSISGMIATVLGVAFLGAALLSPTQGIVMQALRRRRQQMQFSVEMLVVHLATHEGTPAEAEESRFLHLERELGWTPERAEKIVERAIASGLVTTHESSVHLTDEGRQLARHVATR